MKTKQINRKMIERIRLGRGPVGLLVAAVLTVGGMAVTGCSDDDEPSIVYGEVRAWEGNGDNLYLLDPAVYHTYSKPDSMIIECYPEKAVVRGEIEYREMPLEKKYVQFDLNDKTVAIPEFGTMVLNVDIAKESKGFKFDNTLVCGFEMKPVDRKSPNYLNAKFIIDENKTDHTKIMLVRLYSSSGQQQIHYQIEQADTSKVFNPNGYIY